MEVRNTYISCMDTAYVRESPSPKQPYKVQYLHFRYLKFLVSIPNFCFCRDLGISNPNVPPETK